jgi:uncharacterized protein (TIGR02996 family)
MVDRDEQSLLAAIRRFPADDLCRLVYADWLDERGGDERPRRAEFIRVQVELARWANPIACPTCGGDWQMASGWHDKDADPGPDVFFMCEHDHEWRYGDRAKLVERERDLFQSLCERLTDEVGAAWKAAPTSKAVRCRQHQLSADWPYQFVYARGFLDEVIAADLEWLVGGRCRRCGGRATYRAALGTCPVCSGTGVTAHHLADLARRHPVRRAVASDRVPHETEGLVWWTNEWGIGGDVEPQDLPPRIFRHLKRWERRSRRAVGYASAAAATDALSNALLAEAAAVAAASREEP